MATFLTVTAGAIGTSPVTIYTNGTANKTMVLFLNLSNTTVAAVTATVQFRDNSAGPSNRSILTNNSIPATTALSVVGDTALPKIILEPNDSLIVTAGTAASLDAVCSLLEGLG